MCFTITRRQQQRFAIHSWLPESQLGKLLARANEFGSSLFAAAKLWYWILIRLIRGISRRRRRRTVSSAILFVFGLTRRHHNQQGFRYEIRGIKRRIDCRNITRSGGWLLIPRKCVLWILIYLNYLDEMWINQGLDWLDRKLFEYFTNTLEAVSNQDDWMVYQTKNFKLSNTVKIGLSEIVFGREKFG